MQRSLGKMLARELPHRQIPNPIYDPSMATSYGGLASLTTVDDVMGGILAEEMGTGKTAICIALILATRGQMARLPSEFACMYPGLPSYGKAAASLQDICAAHIARARDHRRLLLSQACHERIAAVGPPSYYLSEHSARADFSMRRARRRRRVLLSHATLIISPKTLLEQTFFEFGKFAEAGALEVLLIRDLAGIPVAERLVEHDVVILPATLLQQANLRWDAEEEPDYSSCTWYVMGHQVERACQFGGAESCANCYRPPPSPLLQVHWLRIIVDEGHVMGSSNTKQTTVASALNAEKRWIVSGTPTPQGSMAKELEYLHGLFSFLRVRPWWTAEPKLVSAARNAWRDMTQEATRGEPLPDALTPLMNQIMVRTRLEEVEKEVKLPPLRIAVRLLPWQLPDALRYNHIAAQILLNLITSRGEGVDSLLHSENFRFAMKSAHHLLEACFHTPGLQKDERFLALEVIDEEIAGRTHDFSGKAIDPISDAQRASLLHMKTLFGWDGWAGDAAVQSTKMTYLLRKIGAAAPGDKTIVFSQSNDTLRRVADLLDKADISFCEFHQRMSASERASNLLTFCTSDNRAVILMKTELAAYGINLSCANHVYFLDPVWDRPREAQAIKRAYRIGQTRPVIVEKLVMENSIEQQMLKLLSEQVTSRATVEEHRRVKTILSGVSLLALPDNVPFPVSLPGPPSPPSSFDPEIEFTASPSGSQPPTPSAARATSIKGSVIGQLNRKRKVRFGDELDKEDDVVAVPSKEQALASEQSPAISLL